MSENTMPEQDEVALNGQPPAPAEGLAGPLADIDPEKLKLLEERLAEFKKGQDETGGAAAGPPKFDLEKWEVEPELEHLYRRSQLEGDTWVVIEHQYLMISGQWHIEHGGEPRMQNNVVVKDKQGRVQFHAKGLDMQVADIVNGPEGMLSREKGWRLSALLPGAMGQGVAVLERQAKRALPAPKPIIKPEEQPLEKTTDEELARMEEKSKEWTGEPEKQPSEG